MNVALCKEITEVEIQSAVKQLGTLKAPGKEGFTGFFFRNTGILLVFKSVQL